jgi:FkbM family methyltransferase
MIVFDVGANNGDSNIHYAEQGHAVYAFEPTPELIEVIKAKTKHLPNYVLTETAVSNFIGQAKFNVAGQCDWGCSSLHEFSDNLAETWPGRGDFVKTQEIQVPVTTLAEFLDEHAWIDRIDYLHIDTQGSDLDVLKGLGSKISIVLAGVCEASKPGYELYKGTDNSRDSIVSFLTEHGFEIEWIQNWSEEFNIKFKRK